MNLRIAKASKLERNPATWFQKPFDSVNDTPWVGLAPVKRCRGEDGVKLALECWVKGGVILDVGFGERDAATAVILSGVRKLASV